MACVVSPGRGPLSASPLRGGFLSLLSAWDPKLKVECLPPLPPLPGQTVPLSPVWDGPFAAMLSLVHGCSFDASQGCTRLPLTLPRGAGHSLFLLGLQPVSPVSCLKGGMLWKNPAAEGCGRMPSLSSREGQERRKAWAPLPPPDTPPDARELGWLD